MTCSECQIKSPSIMTVYSHLLCVSGHAVSISSSCHWWSCSFQRWSWTPREVKHNCPGFPLTGGCGFLKIMLGWEGKRSVHKINTHIRMLSHSPVRPVWKQFSPWFQQLCFNHYILFSPKHLAFADHCTQAPNPSHGAPVLQNTRRMLCTDVHFVRNNNSCKSLLQANSTGVHLITSQTKSTDTSEIHKPVLKEFVLVTAWISPSRSNSSASKLPSNTKQANHQFHSTKKKLKPQLWYKVTLLWKDYRFNTLHIHPKHFLKTFTALINASSNPWRCSHQGSHQTWLHVGYGHTARAGHAGGNLEPGTFSSS